MQLEESNLGKLEPGKLEPVKISLRVSKNVLKTNNVDCITGVFSNTLLMHLTYIRELLTACNHNDSDEYMLFMKIAPASGDSTSFYC